MMQRGTEIKVHIGDKETEVIPKFSQYDRDLVAIFSNDFIELGETITHGTTRYTVFARGRLMIPTPTLYQYDLKLI